MEEHYLRIGDVNHAEIFCPLAFFVTDMTQRDSKIRSTYTQALKGCIEMLEGMTLSTDRASGGDDNWWFGLVASDYG
ncbi:hypothetical protein [Marinagarivorans cellulosilyticus]|uniref:Uncharacterized protein n=1 Tax=Marinagarivorans cellulosilyticus TaxID=2721545 RepID=A0AAN1WEY6_9GAMM|nr:hypothetical protein [Marinagarivorans cellulosilyticus]BCD96355.1 hypothetical protein MARGE09_P0555 [Marinagarivorans cellulosilyticus]